MKRQLRSITPGTLAAVVGGYGYNIWGSVRGSDYGGSGGELGATFEQTCKAAGGTVSNGGNGARLCTTKDGVLLGVELPR